MALAMDAVRTVGSVGCRLTSVVGVLADAVCLVRRVGVAVAVELLVRAARSVCHVVCSGGDHAGRPCIHRDPISRGSQKEVSRPSTGCVP